MEKEIFFDITDSFIKKYGIHPNDLLISPLDKSKSQVILVTDTDVLLYWEGRLSERRFLKNIIGHQIKLDPLSTYSHLNVVKYKNNIYDEWNLLKVKHTEDNFDENQKEMWKYFSEEQKIEYTNYKEKKMTIEEISEYILTYWLPDIKSAQQNFDGSGDFMKNNEAIFRMLQEEKIDLISLLLFFIRYYCNENLIKTTYMTILFDFLNQNKDTIKETINQLRTNEELIFGLENVDDIDGIRNINQCLNRWISFIELNVET